MAGELTDRCQAAIGVANNALVQCSRRGPHLVVGVPFCTQHDRALKRRGMLALVGDRRIVRIEKDSGRWQGWEVWSWGMTPMTFEVGTQVRVRESLSHVHSGMVGVVVPFEPGEYAFPEWDTVVSFEGMHCAFAASELEDEDVDAAADR